MELMASPFSAMAFLNSSCEKTKNSGRLKRKKKERKKEKKERERHHYCVYLERSR